MQLGPQHARRWSRVERAAFLGRVHGVADAAAGADRGADRAVREQVQPVEVGADRDQRHPAARLAQVRDDVLGLVERVALAAEDERDRPAEVSQDRRRLREVAARRAVRCPAARRRSRRSGPAGRTGRPRPCSTSVAAGRDVPGRGQRGRRARPGAGRPGRPPGWRGSARPRRAAGTAPRGWRCSPYSLPGRSGRGKAAPAPCRTRIALAVFAPARIMPDRPGSRCGQDGRDLVGPQVDQDPVGQLAGQPGRQRRCGRGSAIAACRGQAAARLILPAGPLRPSRWSVITAFPFPGLSLCLSRRAHGGRWRWCPAAAAAASMLRPP